MPTARLRTSRSTSGRSKTREHAGLGLQGFRRLQTVGARRLLGEGDRAFGAGECVVELAREAKNLGQLDEELRANRRRITRATTAPSANGRSASASSGRSRPRPTTPRSSTAALARPTSSCARAAACIAPARSFPRLGGPSPRLEAADQEQDLRLDRHVADGTGIACDDRGLVESAPEPSARRSASALSSSSRSFSTGPRASGAGGGYAAVTAAASQPRRFPRLSAASTARSTIPTSGVCANKVVSAENCPALPSRHCIRRSMSWADCSPREMRRLAHVRSRLLPGVGPGVENAAHPAVGVVCVRRAARREGRLDARSTESSQTPDNFLLGSAADLRMLPTLQSPPEHTRHQEARHGDVSRRAKAHRAGIRAQGNEERRHRRKAIRRLHREPAQQDPPLPARHARARGGSATLPASTLPRSSRIVFPSKGGTP